MVSLTAVWRRASVNMEENEEKQRVLFLKSTYVQRYTVPFQTAYGLYHTLKRASFNLHVLIIGIVTMIEWL